MIGDEVRRRREELELTGAQLADRAGMAPSAVSQIETGKRVPSSASVEKLATALGIEPGELYPKKAQAPLPWFEDDQRGGAADTSRTALRELDSLSIVVRGVIEDYESIIRDLPEPPTEAEYRQAAALLVPLLRQTDRVNRALLETGLAEASNALRDAPDGNKVREFHDFVDRMNAMARVARVWLLRLPEMEKLHSPGLLDVHQERWRQEVLATEEAQSA